MAGNLSVTREYDRVFSLVQDKLSSNVLFDNASSRTAYLYAMKLKGNMPSVDGRANLRFSILKELPSTIGYTDDDTLTPTRPDAFTSAIFEWKQLATPVNVTGRDMIRTENGAIADMLTALIMAAETGMRESLGGSSVGVFSTADETELRKFSGLQSHLTNSTTTGTVGNLSRATLTAWRHQSSNVSSAFATNGLDRFRTLYRQCGRFDENVDLIVLTGSTMDNYEDALTSTFHVNLPLGMGGQGNADMIDAGFWNIRYKNAMVFADDSVPANYGYFLNSKYIKLYMRQGRESELGDFVKSRDKDDVVAYVYTAGNQCITALARHGVLLNGDTN